MIELKFVYNGHRAIKIGTFWNVKDAVEALKRHQEANPVKQFEKLMEEVK